jgi:hypothetical protein
MTGTAMRLRVTSGESWASSDLSADAGDSVSSVKARILAADRVPASRAGQYEVKVGGALVSDESRTLASLGIGDGSALIVLPRRRRPVR